MEDLRNIVLVITLSSIFSFIISFPIIKILYRFNITRRMTVDFTTLIEKRNLKIGVPIMGGLIFIVTIFLFNILFNPYNFSSGLLLILFIFVLSALLGGFDDVLNIYGRDRAKPKTISRVLTLIKVHKNLGTRIWMLLTLPWSAYKSFFYILGSNPGKGIQAHEKILVQSVAGVMLGIGLYAFSSRLIPGLLWIPIFNMYIDIGILIIPFAWVTVLLMSNAVNLADGMDGLATNQLIMSFFGFLIIALLKDDQKIVFLISTILGSLISYLYFNIPPARFQMGDVGSLAMGSLLAGIAFILGEPLMLLIICLPFALILLSTIIQGLGRRILGRRVFAMAPLHYHFQIAYGWSEEKVVMRFTLFSLFCTIIGLLIYTIR